MMQKRTLVRLVLIVGCLVPAAMMLAYSSFRASAQGIRIAYGDTVEGDIAGAGEIDTWHFEGSNGDVIAVQVQRASGNLQPSVALTSPDGTLLVALDSPEQGAAVASFTASLRSNGEHSLTVAGSAGTTGSYTLDLKLQQSSQPSGNGGGVIAYGQAANGVISDDVFRQFWSFRGTQGDVIDAVMTAASGDLDANLSLSTPDGTVITSAEAGDSGEGAGLYAVKLPVSGTYSLIARRTGANFGANGTTQGAYVLSLTLRTPGLPDSEATPAALPLGTETRGRLTADAPTALYSVEAGGILSVALDLVDPLRVGTLSIMTPEQALLDVFSGTVPLRVSTVATGQNRVLIEVAAAGIREDAPVDFALRVDRLSANRRSSEPLQYGEPREISRAEDQPESWHFAGEAGEMITIRLEPFSPVLGGVLRVFAPDSTLLAIRTVDAVVEQPLALAADGLYEVVVDPTAAAGGGYRITITRDGMSGLAFRQRALAEVQGIIRPGVANAVSADLPPGSSHAWTLDIQQAQVWAFELNQTGANAPLALVVEEPDGTWLETAVSDRLPNAAYIQLLLPRAGRYRAVVFDPTGVTANSYTLSGEPVEGGNLPLNIPTKGVLTPARGRDVWTLTAAAGSHLNLRVHSLEEGLDPVVFVIGPGGRCLFSPWQDDGAGILGVPLVEGGEYRIVIGQPKVTRRTVYYVSAEVVPSFQGPTGTSFVSDWTEAEVFVPDKTPSPPSKQVNIFEQITLPVRPDPAAFSGASAIETGSLIRGEIAPGTVYQVWSLNVGAGQMLGVSAVALDGAGDPDLVLLDQQGGTLAEYFQTDSTTAYMTFRVPTAGLYYVVVRLEKGGRYLLWVDALTSVDERVPDVIPGPLLVYGQTVLGTLSLPGGSRQYAFYGSADDVIMANAVVMQGGWQPQVAILDSNGVVLEQVNPGGNRVSAGMLDNVHLPRSGLYRLEITPVDGSAATQTGSFSLHLNLRRASGIANRGGGALRDRHYGQLGGGELSQRWLFEAKAGEAVTVQVEPLAPGGPTPLKLQLADSTGHVFLDREARFGQGALVLSEVLLPRSGIYQAVISGGQRQAGQYRLSLSRSSAGQPGNDNVAIGYGETRGRVLTKENYLDVWTFAGSRGDIINVLARTIRGDSAQLNWQLRTQGGQVLITVTDNGTGTGARAEAIVLPEDGPYSIIVGNPDGAFEGEAAYALTVHLEGTSARSMGGEMAYGQTVEGDFFADDLADTWLFEGEQGDRITAIVTGEEPALTPSISLVSTDWHVVSQANQAEIIANAQAVNGSPAQIQAVLPAAGPYAVIVRDPMYVGGHYRLELLGQSPHSLVGTTITPGLPQNGQLGAGQGVDFWKFRGEARASVTITMTPDSRSPLAPAILLIGPTGSPVARAEARFGQTAQLETYQLPEEGIYAIQVTAVDGDARGRYVLDLHQTPPSPVTASATTYDRLERGLLDAEIPVQHWSFTGQAGDVVHIFMEATSGDLDPSLHLYDPSGVLIATGDDERGLNADTLVTLSTDGTYVLEVMRYGGDQGTTSGNYAVVIENVYRLGPVVTGRLLVYGERVVGAITGQEPSVFWTFMGEQGDTFRAKIQFAQDDAPLLLFLQDPAGTTLASGVRDRGNSVIDAFTLPASGQYTLEVRRPGDARASYSPYALDLDLIGTAGGVVQNGGILVPGQTVTGRIGDIPDAHLWIFEGDAGQTFAVSMTALQGPFDVQVTLTAPDGAPIFSTQASASVTRALSSGPLTMPLDGLYTLLVTGQKPGLIYRLALQPAVVAAGDSRELKPLRDIFSHLDNISPQETWTFEAAVGDVIALHMQATSGNLEPVLTLWAPDGLPLATSVQQSGRASITALVAPQSGRFSVTAGRAGGVAGSTSGNYRLMLRTSAVTAKAAEAIDVAFGETVTGYASRWYAFQGLAGDLIGISVRMIDGGALPVLRLETETGLPVEVPVATSGGEAIVPAFVLPEEARYVLTLETGEAARYELTVFRRGQDTVQASIVRDLLRSREAAEGLDNPVQPVYWNFAGKAGEVLIFTINTTGGGLRADVALRGPRGYIAAAVERPGSRVTTLGPVRLPEDGAYVLVVGSWLNKSSGRFTVRADEAEPGVSGSEGGHIPAPGQVVTGGLIPEDDRDGWTFEGRAGSVITVRAEQTYGDGALALDLIGPGGTNLASGQASTAYLGVEIKSVVLPDTGIYRLIVRGQLAATNPQVEYRLAVIEEQSPVVASMASAQGIAYGEVVTGTPAPEAPYLSWVFWGQAGERIHVIFQPEGGKLLYLVGPDGRILFAGSGRRVDEISGLALPENGFYGLVVGYTSESASGAFTLQLERLPAGAAPQGALGDSSSGLLTGSTPIHQWALVPGFAGDYVVWLDWLSPGPLPDLFVMDTNNQPLTRGVPANQQEMQAAVELKADQLYTVIVSGGPSVAQGQYTIHLMPAAVLTGGGEIGIGEVNIGRISDRHLSDEWHVGIESGQQINIEIARVSGDLVPQVLVFDSGGNLIADQAAADGGSARITIQAPGTGRYSILVSRLGGPTGQTTGDYTIALSSAGE